MYVIRVRSLLLAEGAHCDSLFLFGDLEVFGFMSR